MDVTRFTETQLIIIEGVPGAGKTQLQERLKQSVEGRTVHVFPEEALLFGWMHAWLPGIDALRISLMHCLLDHIEALLAQDPQALFILNRFHISYLVFAKMPDSEAYDALLARLRQLAVLVLVPRLGEADVADRALHLERDDPLWRTHLDKRLATSGFSELAAMYLAEQESVRQILSAQQLPYEILDAAAFAYSRNSFVSANEK
jgi:hypothetical protein